MFASSIARMPRLRERAVGQDAYLRAGVALRLDADLVQRDRQQADRHLLAGRRDDVELARIRLRRDLLREPEQPVRLAAHRGHDDRPVDAPAPCSARRAARRS
jgi:hypothetical protein